MSQPLLEGDRFHACCAALGATRVPAQVFSELVAAYSEPHRAYHSPTHVQACLDELDAHAHLAQELAEVEMGLWFHDAIYDTRSTDSELRSARWAREVLLDGGAPAQRAERVAALIMATLHDAAPVGDDARLLVDVDLSILGQSPERFERFEAEIRTEYAWVPVDVYRGARARILGGFLERPRIYSTAPLIDRYEQHARRNLEAAIAALRQEGPA